METHADVENASDLLQPTVKRNFLATTSHVRHVLVKYYREALFGAGAGMLCFGCMPFWTGFGGQVIWTQAFDVVTIVLAIVFAFLGVATIALSCLVVPKHWTVWLIRALRAPLLVMTLIATVMVVSLMARNEVAAQWRAQSLVGFDTMKELGFERQMNDLYCHAKAIAICHDDTIRAAQQVFKIDQWPQNPAQSIQAACVGFDDSTRQWGFPPEQEICAICNRIKREEVNPHDSQLVLLHRRTDYQLMHGPYRQHRFEFMQLWNEGKTPYTLKFGGQLLSILVCFAVLSLMILNWWERNDGSLASATTEAMVANTPILEL